MHLQSALSHMMCVIFFFFNDTATTEIYTLSLHDALPIWATRACPMTSARCCVPRRSATWCSMPMMRKAASNYGPAERRSEEHTSELQSLTNLVCRLLLEKNKNEPLTTAQHHARLPYSTDQ